MIKMVSSIFLYMEKQYIQARSLDNINMIGLKTLRLII